MRFLSDKAMSLYHSPLHIDDLFPRVNPFLAVKNW